MSSKRRIANRISFRQNLRFGLLALGFCVNTNVWAGAVLYTVNTAADNLTGAGTSGSLRYCITQANLNPGSTIQFTPVAGQTITLLSALPFIETGMTFTAAGIAPVTIDASSYRMFAVIGSYPAQPVINFTVNNLTLKGGLSQGGVGGGGSGSGGGALGAGGAIFANKVVNLSLTDVNFVNNVARGGDSIAPHQNPHEFSAIGSGGGGMWGGNGGSTWGSSGGGGGGGLVAKGGSSSDGTNGGPFSEAGATGPLVVTVLGGGSGSALGGTNGGGGSSGGYGAGGGGIGGANSAGNVPGNGGEFGGGGGTFVAGGNPGGNGGFGGGGGGGTSAGLGGFGAGNGTGTNGRGNGGSGFGGSIFVRQGGTVTINTTNVNTSFTGGSVVAGAGQNNGAAEGQDLYFMTGVTGNLVIAAGRTQTLNGSIGGDGFLNANVDPTANLILANSNSTYTGGTLIQGGGTVQIAAMNSLGSSGSITIASGSTLQFNNTGINVNRFITLDPGPAIFQNNGGITTTISSPIFESIPGSSSLTYQGGGTFSLTAGSTNVYSAGTYILGATTVGMVTNDNFGVNAGTIRIAGNSTLLFNVNGINLNFPVTLKAGGGNFRDSGAPLQFTTTLAGLIDEIGSQTITYQGPGTFLPIFNNTYTGGTNISGGKVAITALNNLGAGGGVNISNNSILQFNATGIDLSQPVTLGAGDGVLANNNFSFITTVSGLITGNNLTYQGSGIFIPLNVGNNYINTSVSGGTTVQISDVKQLGTGTVFLSGNSGIQFNVANMNYNRTLTLAMTGGGFLRNGGAFTTIISGPITESGPQSISYTGGGIFNVQGANNYTGGTSILNATILQINSLANLGPSGALNMAGNSQLQFNVSGMNLNRAITLTANSVPGLSVTFSNNGFGFTTTISGIISEQALVRGVIYNQPIPGAGGTFIVTGANTYSGGTTISGGTVQVAALNSLGTGALTLSNGGTLQLSTTGLSLNFGVVLGAGGGAFSSTTAGITTTIYSLSEIGGPQVMTFAGPGTFIINGINTYSGGTNITGGNVQIAGLNALGPGPITMSNGGAVQFNTTGINVNLGVTIGAGGGAFNNTGANITTTISSAIGQTGGSQAMTFMGAGTYILQAANTYTGGTNINASTVQIGAANQLGAGTLSLNNGANLQFRTTGLNITAAVSLGVGGGTFGTNAPGYTETLSGVISDTGGAPTLNLTGGAQYNLTANNLYTGATNVSGGSNVVITAMNNLGTGAGGGIGLAGSTLTFNATGITVNRPITLSAGSGTLNNTGAYTTTIAGAIGQTGGPQSLTFSGSGTFILQAANTYSGGTNITGGTVQIAGGNSLGTGGINLSNGANLQINTTGTNLNAAITLGAGGATFSSTAAGIITTVASIIGQTGGAQALTYAGPGTFILQAANTYSGGTTISGGTVQIAALNSLGTGSVSLKNGGNLQFNTTGVDLNFPVVLGAGGGAFSSTTAGITTTISSPISEIGLPQAMTFAGPGTFILNAVNTYSGGTNITGGNLQIAALNSLGPGLVTLKNGGALQFNTTGINLNFGITLGAGGGAFNNTGANITTTISRAIGETGGSQTMTFMGAGTYVLQAPNTYTGGTNINASTVQIGAANQLGAGTLSLSNGASLQLRATGLNITSAVSLGAGGGTFDTDAPGYTETISGVISDTGGAPTLNLKGGAQYNLSANNLYTGATTISGGSNVAITAMNNLGTGAGGGIGLAGATLTFNATGINVNRAVNLSAGGGTFKNNGAFTTTVSGSITETASQALTYQGVGIFVVQGANSYTGGTTIAGGTTVQINALNNLGASGAVIVAGGSKLQFNASGMNVNRTLTLGAGDGILVNNGAFSTTLSGPIGGNNLTYQGGGIFIPTAANNYINTTVLGATTIAITNLNQLGTGSMTLAGNSGIQFNTSGMNYNRPLTLGTGVGTGGGVLTNNGAGINSTISGVISELGAQTLTYQTNGGIFIVQGANTYSGGTNIAGGGTVQIAALNALGTGAVKMFGNSTLQFNVAGLDFNLPLLLGNGLGTGSAIFKNNIVGSTTTVSSVISEAGSQILTYQANGGSFIVSGANTYTGGTNVNNGTVQITAMNNLGTSGGVNLFNATLGFGANGINMNRAVTLSGLGSGFSNSGAFTTTVSGSIGETGGSQTMAYSGPGIFILQGVNTYTGGTILNGGKVQIGAVNNLGIGSIAINNSSTVEFNFVNSNNFNFGVNYPISLGVGGGKFRAASPGLNINIASVISEQAPGASVTYGDSGNGGYTITGTNTYSGATNIVGVPVTINALNNLGTGAAGGINISAGGGLWINTNGTNVNRLITLGTVAGSGGTIANNVAGLTTTLSGGIAETNAPQALTLQPNNGTIVLAAPSTFTGATNLNGPGNVEIAATSSLGTGGGGTFMNNCTLVFNTNGINMNRPITINAGGASFSNKSAGITTTFSSAIGEAVASQSVTFNGTGNSTFNLNAANTYTGATTINGGIVEITALNNLGVPFIPAQQVINLLSGATLRFNTTGVDVDRSINLGVGGGTISTTTAGVTTLVSSVIGETGGSRALNFIGPGNLILQGVNTYTGGTNITSGVIEIGTIDNLGAGVVAINNNAILRFNAGLIMSRNVMVGAGGATFNSTAGGLNVTLSGQISDLGGAPTLNFAGGSQYTLQSNNTYTGATNITGNSTVVITTLNNLGTGFGGGIGLAGNATLALNASGLNVNRPITLGAGGGVINNAAGATNTVSASIQEVGGSNAMTWNLGTGRIILTNTSVNTYSGNTTINGTGVLEIAALSNLGTGVGGGINANGCTLQFNNSGINFNRPILISNSGANAGPTFFNAGPSITTTISGVISEAIAARPMSYAGLGNFVFTNTSVNTYTGGTNLLGGGTVQIVASNNLGIGAVNISGGTALEFNVDLINLANPVVLGAAGGVFNNNGVFTTTFSGVISEVGGPQTVTFGNGGGVGGTFNLTNTSVNTFTGGTIVGGNSTLKIALDNNLGAVTSPLNVQSGSTLAFSAPMTVNAARVISLGTGVTFDNLVPGTVTVAAKITGGGAGGLTLLGAAGATTELSNLNNDYLGGTSLQGGTFVINSDANLGNNNGAITFGAANTTLQMGGAVNSNRSINIHNLGSTIDSNGFVSTLGGQISGSGLFTKVGAGTLGLTSALNNFTGGLSINNGSVAINDDNNLGDTAGAVFIQNGAALVWSTAPITLNAARVITIGTSGTLNNGIAGTSTILSKISGGGVGGLTVVGTAAATTVLANNTNDFLGGINIQGGILQTNADANLGDLTGGITFGAANSALRFAADMTSNRSIALHNTGSSLDTGTFNVTLSGQISGVGSLTKLGTGTATLTNGVNNYSGGVVVAAGTLVVAADAALGVTAGPVTLENGSTLGLAAPLTLNPLRVVTLNGAATINNSAAGTATIAAKITGAGSLTLLGTPGSITELSNNTNDYLGGTILQGGTTLISSDANLGDISGSLTFAAPNTILKLGTAVNSNRTLNISSPNCAIDTGIFDSTFTGVINGTDVLFKIGTGKLTMNYPVNNNQSGIVVNSGTLAISTDADLGPVIAGLTLENSAALVLNAPVNIAAVRPLTVNNLVYVQNAAVGTSTIAGPISGSANVVFSSVANATTSLTNPANNYTGGTTLNGGTLQVASDQSLGDSNAPVNFVAPDSTLAFGSDTTSNRTITLQQANNVIDSGNSTVTLNGQIVANQPLLVGGNGTLIVTNPTNTFPNGINIQSGTLQGTAASLAADITQANLTNLVFDEPATTAFANTIAGTGNIIKQNVGSLRINNAVTANLTSINNGELSINAAYNSPVNVNAGGALRGTGTITGHVTVANNARIRAGNSIGTINIVGNLNLLPASTTDLEINILGQSSIYAVTGIANVDGTLHVIPNPGTYPANAAYPFLTAPVINGNFTAITGIAGTNIRVEYDSVFAPPPPVGFHSLSLVLGNVYVPPPPPPVIQPQQIKIFGNVNERSVASFLNNLPSVPVGQDLRDNVIEPLRKLTDSNQIIDALESISPGRMEAGNVALQQNAEIINSISATRLSGLRQNDRMGDVVISVHGFQQDKDPLSALNELKGKSIAKQKSFNTTQSGLTANAAQNIQPLIFQQASKGSVWIYGLGHVTDQKAYKLDPAYHGKSGGVMTGLDFSPYQNTFVGLGLGKTLTNIRFGNNGGNADLHNTFGMLYGTWYPNQWYMDASIIAGALRYQSKQHIAFLTVDRVANSEHKGYGITPHVGFGYDFNMADHTVTPYMHLDYSFIHEDAYTSTQAQSLNQTVQARSSSTMRTEVGIKYSNQFNFTTALFSGVIKPNANISFINKQSLKKGNMKVGFVGQPGTYTVQYYSDFNNKVSPGVGVDMVFEKNTFFSIHADTEIGNKYTSYEVAAKLGIRF